LHEPGNFELAFFPLTIASLITGSQFRKIAGWRIHGWYSMITGLLTIIPPLANLAPQTPLSNPSRAVQFGGLFERILLVIVFAWYVILAIHMLTAQEKPAASQTLTPQHASFLHSYSSSGGNARSIRLSTISF
jgi:hypothetical protein